jgi:hypothetical protein
VSGTTRRNPGCLPARLGGGGVVPGRAAGARRAAGSAVRLRCDRCWTIWTVRESSPHASGGALRALWGPTGRRRTPARIVPYADHVSAGPRAGLGSVAHNRIGVQRFAEFTDALNGAGPPTDRDRFTCRVRRKHRVVDRLPTIDLVSPEQPSAHRYVVHYTMGCFAVMVLPLAVLVGGSTAVLAALLIQEVRRPGQTAGEVAFFAVMAVLAAAFGLFMAILGVNVVVATARHWEALRADVWGVTLGRSLIPGSRPVTVPWSSLQAIVLFPVQTKGGGLGLGLRLRPGAERPPGMPGPLRGWILRTHRMGVPAEVFRVVNGWQIDPERLAAAARAHGPHVQLIGEAGWEAELLHLRAPRFLP